jgi:hypothetical protein
MASPSTPRPRPLTEINDQIRDVTAPLNLIYSVSLPAALPYFGLFASPRSFCLDAPSQVLASLPTVTCSSHILNVRHKFKRAHAPLFCTII